MVEEETVDMEGDRVVPVSVSSLFSTIACEGAGEGRDERGEEGRGERGRGEGERKQGGNRRVRGRLLAGKNRILVPVQNLVIFPNTVL